MNTEEGGRGSIKMLAVKPVVKNGLIKPLGATDPQEDKEIVVYILEQKETEEYSEWTDEDRQRFSLHSFMNASANAVSEWKNPEEEEVWK